MDFVLPVPIDPTGRSGPTKRMAAGPHWRRTSPGLYVPAVVDPCAVEQRIVEAAGRLPPSGAVTGWAALRLLGLNWCDGRGQPVPLVVPPGVGLRPAPGLVVHRERLPESDARVAHGIRICSPNRATFDAARRAAGLRESVTVLDLALTARIIDRLSFAEDVQNRRGWPGVSRVREALPLADDRCLSPMESRLRLIWCLDAGLPRPKCNWPVADEHGRFIGRPDLLSEELAVVGEFDGSEHRSRSRHRDDLRRDDEFRRAGLETFRVVGADLADTRLVLRRIHEAIQRAEASGAPRTWRVKNSPGSAY